jgi:hypothetical protein
MDIAKAIGGELTEARLKALIKLNGGSNSMPKIGMIAEDDLVGKSRYVVALIGVLRARHGNDYSKVVKLLEAEFSKGKGKKGFKVV